MLQWMGLGMRLPCGCLVVAGEEGLVGVVGGVLGDGEDDDDEGLAVV